MKIILDGKNAVLGRIASYVAKQALKGKEISIVNCEKIIITGNKVSIKKDFERKRSMVGNSQKGPKHPKVNEIVVKRAIRGMIPNHREGRGKDVYRRIKCYKGIPKEFENVEKEVLKMQKKNKFSRVEDFTKC